MFRVIPKLILLIYSPGNVGPQATFGEASGLPSIRNFAERLTLYGRPKYSLDYAGPSRCSS